jgi:hypothetical protein
MQWVLGLGAALATSGAIATGCGGSENNTSPADSGSDVTTDQGGKDVAAEASDAMPDGGLMCPYPTLESYPIPDADIPNTKKPVEGCVSCVEMACPALIKACDMDCSCRMAFANFVACFVMGQPLLQCAQAFSVAGNFNPADLACGFPCAGACGQGGLGDAGSDAGAESGGDAAAD